MLKLLPFVIFTTLALVPAASASARNRVLDRRFEIFDINDSNSLDATEFLALQSRARSWADTIHRFNAADVDDDGFLSQIEFRASNGGMEGGRPSKSEAFVLADLDDDGYLNPDEYARTQPQSRPWRSLVLMFGRRDRDDDSLLGPREFGILFGNL